MKIVKPRQDYSVGRALDFRVGGRGFGSPGLKQYSGCSNNSRSEGTVQYRIGWPRKMAVPSAEEDLKFCPQLVPFKANYIDIQIRCFV